MSIMDHAIGHRHGLFAPPLELRGAQADLDFIQNWSVAFGPDDPWRAAGGGVGWTEEHARSAALAEALERYSATYSSLPLENPEGREHISLGEFTLFNGQQVADPTFPHQRIFSRDHRPEYTTAYSLLDNRPVLVPAALMGLTDRFGALPTSSGLAISSSLEQSLRRAIQEVIERDAYMITWLHGVVPPRVPLADSHLAPVAERGGWVVAYDITPIYSPHSVAMVIGNLPLEGRPRISLGLACRSTWTAAADKAYLEWSQGVVFAGHRSRREPTLYFPSASDVRSFEDHAVYYTVHPDRWRDIPLTDPNQDHQTGLAPATAADRSTEFLVRDLHRQGIRLFYRDLTVIDVAQVGLSVVRVLSPDLTPIHSDHRWPHLGGTTPQLERRYPAAAKHGSAFPSSHPHPLG